MTIYIHMCNIRFDITTRLEKVSIANPAILMYNHTHNMNDVLTGV